MTLIKREIKRFSSKTRHGEPMYPGDWLLTWMKAPGMPWTLVSVQAAGDNK